jgi:hypothetical protein
MKAKERKWQENNEIIINNGANGEMKIMAKIMAKNGMAWLAAKRSSGVSENINGESEIIVI